MTLVKTLQGFSPISFCGGHLDGANLVVITADAVHDGWGGAGGGGGWGAASRELFYGL